MIRKLLTFKTISIRNRLLIQLGLVAVVISLFLFLVVRLALVQAVTATQDRLLAAAVGSVVDKIYVIDKGEAVGEGKHEELLISSEVYKNFYNKQIKRS